MSRLLCTSISICTTAVHSPVARLFSVPLPDSPALSPERTRLCLLSLPTGFACGRVAVWPCGVHELQLNRERSPSHPLISECPAERNNPPSQVFLLRRCPAGSSILNARPPLTVCLLLPGPAHLFPESHAPPAPQCYRCLSESFYWKRWHLPPRLPVFSEPLTARKKLRRPTIPTCFPVHPRQPSSPSAARGTADTYQRPADASR